MKKEEKVYAALKDLGISYEKHDHPPVYTVEEAKAHWDKIRGAHVKNLFLRNKKGNRHFLVILGFDKRLDIKNLQGIIGAGGLSFASDRRLEEHLGLTPGAVSAFGILNDLEKAVEVVIDQDLMVEELINFHPNVNTATLTISVKDFQRFLDKSGNRVRVLEV